VHLVIRYGPERGLVEARDAFNATFDQMKPILEISRKRKDTLPHEALLLFADSRARGCIPNDRM
jgi:hypothetical protein